MLGLGLGLGLGVRVYLRGEAAAQLVRELEVVELALHRLVRGRVRGRVRARVMIQGRYSR